MLEDNLLCAFISASDDPLLLKAKEMDRSTKEVGARNGVLGHIAIEILQFLLVQWHLEGTLSVPNRNKLSNELKRSKGAVGAALAKLADNKFLKRNNDGLKPRYYLCKENRQGFEI